MIWMLITSLASSWIFASPYFTPLRDDQSVPTHCRDMQMGFYHLQPETMVVGRLGAEAMGYTLEYPIKRENASVLWGYFKKLVKEGTSDLALFNKINKDPELLRDYKIIARNYQELGFSFINEGDILEILAIQDLYRDFPSNEYFITGGVEYHESKDSWTIGEVDIFVGRRSDCSAVAVGETKLGRHRPLKKAKEQLRRFENFLMNHQSGPLGSEYEPVRPRPVAAQAI